MKAKQKQRGTAQLEAAHTVGLYCNQITLSFGNSDLLKGLQEICATFVLETRSLLSWSGNKFDLSSEEQHFYLPGLFAWKPEQDSWGGE